MAYVAYWTSYHLNFVEVPVDVEVSHQTGEPTVVRLVLEQDHVLLLGLK
jgi:hypothetical protein